jgi:hypothetical protein
LPIFTRADLATGTLQRRIQARAVGALRPTLIPKEHDMNVRPLPLVLSAALMFPVLARPAAAQERQVVRISTTSGSDFGMSARVSLRSMESYATLLNLTPDQKTMALTLHEGYETAVQNAQKDFQTVIQDIQKSYQDTQDDSVWMDKMPKARREYDAKTRALEKGLFDDLKSLLSADQQANWGSVERMRRRETVLRSGFASGESVDLIQIVDGLKLSADAKATVGETLRDYETELDRALLAKQASLDQSPAFEPGKPMDPEQMRQRLDKAREEGLKIKEINQRNARKIESQLPEDKRAEFQKAVQEATYPRVYRPSTVVKSIDSALGLADLNAQQRDALQELRSSYQRDLAPLNEHWAAAIEDEEKSGKGGGAMLVPGGAMTVNFGPESESPVSEARKARRELDDRTRTKLEGILTKEQKERLPKELPADDPGRMIFGGDGGMGGQMMIRRLEDDRK